MQHFYVNVKAFFIVELHITALSSDEMSIENEYTNNLSAFVHKPFDEELKVVV